MRHVIASLAVVILSCSSISAVHAQLASDLIHANVDLSVATVERSGKVATTIFQSGIGKTAAAPAIEYTGVIVQGYSEAEEITARWRYLSEDGTASEWIDLYVVQSATDGGFLAGYPGPDVRTEPLQLWIETSDATSPYIVVAGVFDSRLDADKNAQEPEAVKKFEGASAIPTVTPPPLITRSDWGAGPFVSGSPSPLAPSGTYTNITFHHAAGFTATTREEGIVQVRAIQEFHQNGRGWSDIGYQFVIDRGGNVYQGRPFMDSSTTLEEIPRLALGAHVGGANTGNIGICMLGCYHPPEVAYTCTDQATSASLDSYVSMFAFLGQAYEIPINGNTVKGHRDFSSTSCPGDNNYALLPTLREQALQAQQFGNEVPEESVLSQNAPNPFETTTTIRYFLKEEGVVDLRIYDVNGREVAVLENGFKSADRWYQATFDATDLANGVYLSRIRVEGFAGEAFVQTGVLLHVR